MHGNRDGWGLRRSTFWRWPLFGAVVWATAVVALAARAQPVCTQPADGWKCWQNGELLAPIFGTPSALAPLQSLPTHGGISPSDGVSADLVPHACQPPTCVTNRLNTMPLSNLYTQYGGMFSASCPVDAPCPQEARSFPTTADPDLDRAMRICAAHGFSNSDDMICDNWGDSAAATALFDKVCPDIRDRWNAAYAAQQQREQEAKDAADLEWLRGYVGGKQ